MNKQAYEQGFIDTCKAYNVDPHALVKWAGLLDDIENGLSSAGAAVYNGVKSVPNYIVDAIKYPFSTHATKSKPIMSTKDMKWDIPERYRYNGWKPYDVTPSQTQMATGNTLNKITYNIPASLASRVAGMVNNKQQ